MSAIVTQELREVTLAREARYPADAAGKPAPEGPHSTVHVRVTSVGGLNEEAGTREQLERVHRLALAGCPGIATLRDPVAIGSTLQLEEVAAEWRA